MNTKFQNDNVFNFSTSDWDVYEALALLLQQHNTITNELSAERYPTMASVLEDFQILLDHMKHVEDGHYLSDQTDFVRGKYLAPVSVRNVVVAV